MTSDGPVVDGGTWLPDRWRRLAACRTVPLETFFPAPYVSQSEAKAVCQGCAARVGCVRDAIETREHHGIRGGFNFGDQRTRRRASQWLEERLKSGQAATDTRVAS